MPILSAYQISRHGAVQLPKQAKTADEWTRRAPQGLYTTFRTFAAGTRVLGLKAHLNRLYGPAPLLGIQPDVTERELRAALSQILEQNAPSEARVRLILATTGSPGAIFALVEPFHPPADAVYQEGVKTITRLLERATPRLKSTEFIGQSQPARQLVGGDIYEVLLVRSGRILEGMTSNFFYVKDGMVGTARQDILLGVTRRTVLRVVRGSGLGITYRPLKLEQIPALSEAFLTSSSRGIVPIVQIDETIVGQGRPGRVTNRLRDRYKAYVESHAEKLE